MLRLFKLKFSVSASEPELFVAVSLAHLFWFRTYNTALATKEFRSRPSSRKFLAPWNCTWPVTPPQVVGHVKFMTLACACVTFHYFRSCLSPCRGNTSLISFVFYLYFIIIIFLFRRFRGLLLNFSLHQLGGFVAFTSMLNFFVLVWYFTLRLENFLISF